MLLHEKIKERLNIADCLISTYYSNITVRYYDEESSITIKESISDLINGTNNFAIDVSNMRVRIDRFELSKNLLVRVYPQYTVNCYYLKQCKKSVRPSTKRYYFFTLEDAQKKVEELKRQGINEGIINAEIAGEN